MTHNRAHHNYVSREAIQERRFYQHLEGAPLLVDRHNKSKEEFFCGTTGGDTMHIALRALLSRTFLWIASARRRTSFIPPRYLLNRVKEASSIPSNEVKAGQCNMTSIICWFFSELTTLLKTAHEDVVHCQREFFDYKRIKVSHTIG